jgi:hypothetical protein
MLKYGLSLYYDPPFAGRLPSSMSLTGSVQSHGYETGDSTKYWERLHKYVEYAPASTTQS